MVRFNQKTPFLHDDTKIFHDWITTRLFLYIENTYFYNICAIFSFKNCQYIFTNDSGKSALKSFFVQNVETEVFHHTKSTSLFFVTTLKLSYRLFIDMTLISLTIISHLSKFLLVVHLTRWSILDGIPLCILRRKCIFYIFYCRKCRKCKKFINASKCTYIQ